MCKGCAWAGGASLARTRRSWGMAGFVSDHIWSMHEKHRYPHFAVVFAPAPSRPADDKMWGGCAGCCAGGLYGGCTGLCGTISKALAHLALHMGLCGGLCGTAGPRGTYAGTCLIPGAFAWTECTCNAGRKRTRCLLSGGLLSNISANMYFYQYLFIHSLKHLYASWSHCCF